MKKLTVALLLMIVSMTAVAEQYLVYYLYSNVRVVLSTTIECDYGRKSKRAVVQRMDGDYISGCWYLDPTKSDSLIGDQMVHIKWEDRDFTEIPLTLFEHNKTGL